MSNQSEEGRALLQDRLAVFGKWMFLMLLAIGVSFGLVDYAFVEAENPDAGSQSQDLVFQLVPLFMWVGLRRGTRSPLALSIIDVCVMALYGGAFSYACLQMAPIGSPREGAIVIFSAGIFSIARAVVIPSNWFRTLWISTICVVPSALALAWLTSQSPDASDYLRQGGGYVNTLCWAAFGISVATIASKIIFGLRRDIRLAKRLGQYQLEEKIGEGGMGEVYRASHAMMRRPTAIKLLSAQADPTNLARFEREVQLTSRLTHPNTVTIFDYGRTPAGVFYYAMELLDGATLEEIVQCDGAQPPGRVIKILSEVADALSEAHGIHLIHRDIKPANIICCKQGGKADVAKLLDFGLVKEIDTKEDTALTRAESVTGTPLYLAPEAITSPESVDARSDIYALGAVGYFLLTGTHLFQGSSVIEVCGHHMHSRPMPPSERLHREVPPDLELLLLSCLEKDPAGRPQTAAALREKLLDCKSMGEWTEELASMWWEGLESSVRSHRKRRRPQASDPALEK